MEIKTMSFENKYYKSDWQEWVPGFEGKVPPNGGN